MIINRTNLTNLNTGFQTTFRGAFSGVENKYSRITTVIKSGTSIETYAFLAQMPGMEEWIDERRKKGLQTEAYILANKKYEDTVEVPRDAIEDDNYGVYTPVISMMAEAAAALPEELIFTETLPNGFSSKCHDGQNFFDTDHPVRDKKGNETSVSNMQAGGGSAWYLLCTKRPMKPFIYQDRVSPDLIIHDDPRTSDAVFNRDVFQYGTRARGAAGYGYWQMAFGSKAELTAENFEAARTAMMKLKGDGGRPLGLVPDLLLVSPDNETKADEILSVQRKANGADNPNYKKAEILASPWLT